MTTLTVTILQGKGLKAQDTFGKNDDFCTIEVGKQKKKTKTLDGAGANPKWKNEVTKLSLGPRNIGSYVYTFSRRVALFWPEGSLVQAHESARFGCHTTRLMNGRVEQVHTFKMQTPSDPILIKVYSCIFTVDNNQGSIYMVAHK